MDKFNFFTQYSLLPSAWHLALEQIQFVAGYQEKKSVAKCLSTWAFCSEYESVQRDNGNISSCDWLMESHLQAKFWMTPRKKTPAIQTLKMKKKQNKKSSYYFRSLAPCSIDSQSNAFFSDAVGKNFAHAMEINEKLWHIESWTLWVLSGIRHGLIHLIIVPILTPTLPFYTKKFLCSHYYDYHDHLHAF